MPASATSFACSFVKKLSCGVCTSFAAPASIAASIAGAVTACTMTSRSCLRASSTMTASMAFSAGVTDALMISTPAAASERTCARASSSVLKLAGSARPGRDDARPFELARIDAALELHDARHRPAARHQCREARVEELLHSLHGLLAEPLLGVAVDDVAVRVDVAGQHGAAAGVERRLACGSRGTGGDRDDTAVFDDDRTARDVRADVEDACVRDDEILRGRERSGAREPGGEKSQHFVPLSCGCERVELRRER